MMAGPPAACDAAGGRALSRGQNMAGRATEPPCQVPASRPMRATIPPANAVARYGHHAATSLRRSTTLRLDDQQTIKMRSDAAAVCWTSRVAVVRGTFDAPPRENWPDVSPPMLVSIQHQVAWSARPDRRAVVARKPCQILLFRFRALSDPAPPPLLVLPPAKTTPRRLMRDVVAGVALETSRRRAGSSTSFRP